MQKLFRSVSIAALLAGLSAGVQAADLRPAPAPAYQPPVVPLFSWTGFYLGGNLGAGWSNGNLTDSLFGVNWSANNNATFVGGGQVGANYQFNSVVVGVEGDFDWFANNNNSAAVTALGTTVQGSNNGRWLATLTGRLGYAAGPVLFYGKGGGAWVGSNNFTVTNVATGSSVSFANNNTNTGWTAGAGIEWAFYNNWTARLEYDYVGLSNATFTVPATFPVVGGDVFTTHNRNIQMVTVGVNYLFNWGP
ncbi:MAG TPA: outer membrane beta-barrel protein [Xanthobacteraceae bacterium]|jgi:outer membrane immunogenic protein|nr:outer membrane beta-barrel protein [Xanthobacteraceae bacterium]